MYKIPFKGYYICLYRFHNRKYNIVLIFKNSCKIDFKVIYISYHRNITRILLNIEYVSTNIFISQEVVKKLHDMPWNDIQRNKTFIKIQWSFLSFVIPFVQYFTYLKKLKDR